MGERVVTGHCRRQVRGDAVIDVSLSLQGIRIFHIFHITVRRSQEGRKARKGQNVRVVKA